jgi:hypothetical protein
MKMITAGRFGSLLLLIGLLLSLEGASLSANTAPLLGPGHLQNGTLKNPPSPLPNSVSGVLTKMPPDAVVLPPGEVGSIGSNESMVNTESMASGSSLSLAAAQPGVTCSVLNVSTNVPPANVITTPRINLLFWGVWNQTAANAITSTWQTLGATQAFFNREAEYTIQNGSFGQRFPDYTSGISGNQPDCVFAGGLSATLTAAHFTPTANDMFIIFLPSNTSSKYDTGAGYGGHHCSYNFGANMGPTCWNYINASCSNTPPTGCCNNTGGACSGATYQASTNSCTSTATGHSYPLNVNGSSVNLRYAIIENGEPTWVATHEFAETTVNPDFAGYGEIGDVCQFPGANNFMNPLNYIRGIQVQKIWSQAACRCIGERDLNSVGLGERSFGPNNLQAVDSDRLAQRITVVFPALSDG